MNEEIVKELPLTCDSPWEQVNDYLLDTHFQKEPVEAFLGNFLDLREAPREPISSLPVDERDGELTTALLDLELKKTQEILRTSGASQEVLAGFLESSFVQERLVSQWQEQAQIQDQDTRVALKRAVSEALGSLKADAELTLFKGENKFPKRIEPEVRVIWAFSKVLLDYFSEKLPEA